MSVPVTIGLILEIVAAVGEDARDVDAEIARLYEWHHGRAVLAIQLAAAPLAIAALAIVAKGSSTGLVVISGAIITTAISICGWRLHHLNQMDREYAMALRLGRALLVVRPALVARQYGGLCGNQEFEGEGLEARGSRLYSEIGGITMVDYRSNEAARAAVMDALCGAGLTP